MNTNKLTRSVAFFRYAKNAADFTALLKAAGIASTTRIMGKDKFRDVAVAPRDYAKAHDIRDGREWHPAPEHNLPHS